MTVRAVRVGAVASLERRQVSVEPSKTYEEIGMRSFGKGIFHKGQVRGATLGSKRVFKIHPGDLVLSNVFAWEGAIAVAGETEAGKIGSHRFLTYRADPKEADANYLQYFFLSEVGLPLIQRASPGAAGRNRTLGIEAFENLVIPLPDLGTQRRIAARLTAVHAYVKAVQRRAADQTVLLDRLASRLLVSNKAEDTPLRKVLYIDIDSEIVTPSSNFKLAGVYGFGRGLFARGSLSGKETSYKRLHRLHAGQVVLSRLKAFEGAIAVVPPEFDGWNLSPEFPTFSPKHGAIHPGYLAMLCEWPGLRERLQRQSKGMGARRERVSAEGLLNLNVPLPDTNRQQQLGAVHAKNQRIRRAAEHRLALLDALLASTLNQAFSGLE